VQRTGVAYNGLKSTPCLVGCVLLACPTLLAQILLAERDSECFEKMSSLVWVGPARLESGTPSTQVVYYKKTHDAPSGHGPPSQTVRHCSGGHYQAESGCLVVIDVLHVADTTVRYDEQLKGGKTYMLIDRWNKA